MINFLKRIHTLSHSVDYIEDSLFNNLTNSIDKYLKDVLKVTYYTVIVDYGAQIQEKGDNVPSFTVMMSKDGYKKKNVEPIHKDNGEYRGQASYSYSKGRKLWVNSASENGVLEESGDFIESWGGYKDLPDFWDYSDTETRTSVLLPLRYGSRVFGVLTLEFGKYYSFSREFIKPLTMLSDSVSRTFWVHYTSKQSLRDSQMTVDNIEEHMSNDFSFLEKQKVFFSFPAKGDPKVVDAVEFLFKSKYPEFKLILWKDSNNPDDIFGYIDSSIRSSVFGICYFTEVMKGKRGIQYKNNPNVLLEAGMMEAYKNYQGNQFRNWIAIREENENPVPFNISHKNTIIIRRDKKSNEMDVKDFTKRLKGFIKQIIKGKH